MVPGCMCGAFACCLSLPIYIYIYIYNVLVHVDDLTKLQPAICVWVHVSLSIRECIGV